MYPNSSRSTTPDSAAMLGSTSSGSLRHVQFSMSRHQLVRRPSYEQEEDFGQWDEQGADEPFFYDDRDDMRRTQGRGPSPPPQHAKDHMNRFAPRGAPQPKPQHFVPVATQHTGGSGGGGSVKAAVRKFQYRAPEAGASASSLMLPKTGSAPIPILKQNTGQNSAYRRAAAADSTRTAFSAPTGGMSAVMNPAMNDSRDSLLRSNPNLKVVDGELRMAVFPERKRSGDAAGGLQLVAAHRRRGSGSAEREVDITEMGWRERSREREGLRAELARRSQSPEPLSAPPPSAYARPAVAAMAPPVAAAPSVTKAAPAPFRPASADEKALVSPKALVARNFVASIVGELKRGRAKPAAPPPPPPAATKPKASKWAQVDTSAGLKRKWEPGNHVPSTIRSYVHLLSGGPVPHALGRMGSAN